MSLPEDQDARKSIENNESEQHSTKPTLDRVAKYQVWCARETFHVQLPYTWIITWGPILHALAFKVWCILKMQAKVKEGPWKDQTNGWVTFGNLVDLTGCHPRAVRRAVWELMTYGLVTTDEPTGKARSKRGKPLNFHLHQDAPAPSTDVRLTEKGLEAVRSFVDGPTKGQNSPGSLGQNSPGSLGQNSPGSLGQNDQGTLGQNSPGSSYYSKTREERKVTSSSSSSVPPGKPPTTTTAPQIPADLTPLQHCGQLWLDHKAQLDMFLACQAAAPGCTLDEMRHCMSAHENLAAKGATKFPVKYLQACVTTALRGGWLVAYRAAVTAQADQLRQAQSRYQAELDAWGLYEEGKGPSPLTGRMKQGNGAA